ncbi:hypothetical protein [Ferruginibacter sp. SUN106]|uniref:hypothetical protein n=1 Tax=Ferruginibacter sp. SUN106 TaxID=2978348 RepID=UPI003D35A4CF
MKKIILSTVFTLVNLYSFAQKTSDKIIILDSVTAKHGNIKICGTDHYHPVDIKAKLISDSLKAKGIDTLLIYRDWLGTNGFNGYGKVLWLDKGVLKQYRINFINEAPYYGIKSINFSIIKSDSIFSFYFRNNLQSVSTNPTKQDMWMSHDSDHFIYLEANGKIYCFNISGLLVEYNPENLRSKFVRKLMIDASKYIDEVYKK